MIKRCDFTNRRFYVLDWIIAFLHKWSWYVQAPFYFHLGQYWWFIEIVSLGQEMCETFGLYILAFIVIGALIYYRNYFFQASQNIFGKKDETDKKKNTNMLSNYIATFFANLKTTASSFVTKISSIFKKKNKKK